MGLKITGPQTPEIIELLRLLGEQVGGSDLQTRMTTVLADLATIDTVVDGIQTDLDNGTDGLGAIKTAVDTVDTVVDGIQADLSNGTDGLGAIKTVVDANATSLTSGTSGLAALKTLLDTIDTVVDGIQTDLSNGTDGLGAIKGSVDGIQTDLDNATDGLGAIKTAVDTVDTVVDGIQADLSNGTDGLGAIKATADAIETDTQDIQTTLGSPAGASISADLVSIQSVIDGINNSTRFAVGIPSNLIKPAAGTSYYRVTGNLFDATGAPEDADSDLVYYRVLDPSGTALTGVYFSDNAGTAITATSGGSFDGWYLMDSAPIGRSEAFIGIASSATKQGWSFEFGYTENAVVTIHQRASQVLDPEATSGQAEATADAVWDETTSTHTTAGSFGQFVQDIQNDLNNGTDGLGALKTLIDAVQTDLDNGTDGLGAIKTAVDGNNTLLTSGTSGLAALKTLIDTVDTVVDGIQADLSNGTDGLGAIKTAIDTVDTVVDGLATDIGTVTTLGSGATLAFNNTDMAGATFSSATDSLEAIRNASDAVKTVVDGIQTDLDNGTDGLGALKSLIDTVDTNVDGLVSSLGTVTSLVSGATVAFNLSDMAGSGFAATDSLKDIKAKAIDIETDTQAIQTTLGSPAGADVSTDIAAVKSDTAAILTDTSDIQPKIGTPAALSANPSTLAGMIQAVFDKSASEDAAGAALVATDTSAALAAAASEIIDLGVAEGFDAFNALMKRIRITVSGATTDFDFGIYETSAASGTPIFAAEQADGTVDISLDDIFSNGNGTASKNLYVKITNQADVGSTSFTVEVRGLKLADTLA